ncbi:hypothetical protein ACH46_13465 [Gordonia phthalatica]|uniref:Uncharacterized protein n=1 Tax=Gordonia phthalatica TaxID=1136941 RepID=A0A0N9MS51_9ACTN|nr:hypothetical protein ACH46_13465 [Gordonia phthalatica]
MPMVSAHVVSLWYAPYSNRIVAVCGTDFFDGTGPLTFSRTEYERGFSCSETDRFFICAIISRWAAPSSVRVIQMCLRSATNAPFRPSNRRKSLSADTTFSSSAIQSLFSRGIGTFASSNAVLHATTTI